ncbi:MAG TPA: hypothetical protein GXX38_10410 [Clostridia bacterium]|nr:hypothetical protein [Clostridia bacterium]
MRILGLIGSARKLGNSEILVKEALSSIQEKFPEVKLELIRLTDLNIQNCTGCMYCAFSKKICRLEDDFNYLLNKLKHAQGLVLGAPTYILTPSSIIKAIIDRYLNVAPHIESWNSEERMGVSINVAGLPEWNPFGSSLLNIFLFAFQYRLVGSMVAYAPGPGEVLLDKSNIQQACNLGSILIDSLLNPDLAKNVIKHTDNNMCPICFSPVFKIAKDGKVECPVCGLRGDLTSNANNEYIIKFSQILDGFRWSKQAQIKHYEEWIFASKDTFKSKYPQIKNLNQKYVQMDKLWDKR